MITTRTKRQLLVFAFIALVGMAYVGGRYAKLGSLFYDTTYAVRAQFAQSGGIFAGADVTYRGVSVGRVSQLRLTRGGVDVELAIDRGERIPADTIAQVANKSAVGEQHVNLLPRTSSGPYLKDGSTIKTPDTRTPISTTALLTNLDRLVESVPKDDLRTSVKELGTAFAGTGRDLGTIIDTSTSFIETANDNVDMTIQLLRDTDTVLTTQNDKASAIRSFSRDLALLSQTVADKDASLRRVIDNGSATTNQLRTFLEENRVDLGELINNLVTTGEVTRKHLRGIEQVLIAYPYVVAGGFTVLTKGPGGYDARFGLVLTPDPVVCRKGYGAKPNRTPYERAALPMNTAARCAEAGNHRGAARAPNGRPAYGAPVATYDTTTKQLTWSKDDSTVTGYAGGDQELFGRDSSQGLWLRPWLEGGTR